MRSSKTSTNKKSTVILENHKIEDAFRRGFLCGMSVVHSTDTFEQEQEYLKLYMSGKWTTKRFNKLLTKFQIKGDG